MAYMSCEAQLSVSNSINFFYNYNMRCYKDKFLKTIWLQLESAFIFIWRRNACVGLIYIYNLLVTFKAHQGLELISVHI